MNPILSNGYGHQAIMQQQRFQARFGGVTLLTNRLEVVNPFNRPGRNESSADRIASGAVQLGPDFLTDGSEVPKTYRSDFAYLEILAVEQALDSLDREKIKQSVLMLLE